MDKKELFVLRLACDQQLSIVDVINHWQGHQQIDNGYHVFKHVEARGHTFPGYFTIKIQKDTYFQDIDLFVMSGKRLLIEYVYDQHHYRTVKEVELIEYELPT